MACVPTVPMKRVWPSAGALAASAAPMLPPAPARLSTTTGWPSSALSAWPTMRARMSVVPPAEKGTTMVMGLEGNAWARAWLVIHRPAAARLAPASSWAAKPRRVGVLEERVVMGGVLSEKSESVGFRPGPRPGWCRHRHRSEEHTSELQSHHDLVCRLLLE